jgi:hypothetical protein
MNDFAKTIFILGGRTFMMMNFRKCKSMNYIFATETILTSTTGIGQEGGSFHFVQGRPWCTMCHAATPDSMPYMTCFTHIKPMKLNGLK